MENQLVNGQARPDKKNLAQSDVYATQAAEKIAEGNLDEAQKTIGKALQLRMDRSYYHLINGLIYHIKLQKGQSASADLARQGYQLALRFDRTNWLAHYFLGRLDIETSDFDGASHELIEALLLRPDDIQIQESLMYAAYRSGRPDVAAAAVNAMKKASGLGTETTLRNAAIVMAAVGSTDEANSYFEKFRKMSNDPRTVEFLGRRLKDWQDFHNSQDARNANILPVQYSSSSGYGSSGSDSSTAAPLTALPTAPGSESKMVVVDVVMIQTLENISTNQGVNLMSGLTLQFGNYPSTGPGLGFSDLVTKTKGTTTTVSDTQTITRSISLSALSYNLNILNSNATRSEILARPTLVALAGQTSQFFSGSEVNAVAVNQGASGGSPVNIDKEIGVKLQVAPGFQEDGRLRLTVNAERTFIEAPSSNISSFSFRMQTSKNRVTANVVMNYGETLILGGLSEKESDDNRDGVPLIEDTPLIQYLFSNRNKLEYQQSVLILLTPRPPQYVYQSERAREEYEKTLSEDERPLANLRARYSDWFKPYPNWASIFHHLQENSLYREFRTGDVKLESWSDQRSLHDRLNQALDYLYY